MNWSPLLLLCVLPIVGCASGKGPGGSDDSGDTDVISATGGGTGATGTGTGAPATGTGTGATGTGTGTGTTGTGTGANVKTSGPITCADPTARDIQVFDQRRGPETVGEPVYRGHGAGIAAGDWDGTGLPGVVVLGTDVAEAYRQTAPGEFATAIGGYDWASVDMGFGINTADFDADGDLDLFITRYTKANLLLENDGAGRFRDVAAERGVAACGSRGEGHHSSSSVWGDIDNDGDLDLYVGGHGFVDEYLPQEQWDPGDSDCLFLNDGSGTFTDVSDRIPQEAHNTYVLVPALLDLDRDGDLDLYLSNDFGSGYDTCKLLWNHDEGRVFEHDHNEAQLDYPISGMGVAVTDFNDDLVPDLLIPAWNKHGFGVSTQGRNLWVNYYISSGLITENDEQDVAWGAEYADFDNDADEDAAIVYGYIDTNTGPPNPLGQPDGIWLRTGETTYEPAPKSWGFGRPTAARGLLAADLDGNGWVDLGVPDMHGPSVIHMARCGDESWLEVTLRHPGSKNTHAIGAEIVATGGGQRWWRHIHAGGTSYGSGGPPVAHIGLGNLDTLDTLEIRWPDGELTRLENVETRQILTIER